MNIILLLIITLFTIVISEKYARNQLLSITAIASMMYTVDAFVYIINYRLHGSDISLAALTLIIVSLTATGLGELLANNLVLKRSVPENDSEMPIGLLSRKFVYAASVILAIIGAIKLLHIYVYAGGTGGVINAITATRADYLSGEYDDSNKFISLFVILSRPYIYMHLYLLTYAAIHKKYEAYMFLPFIGYSMILLSSTARIGFIKLSIMYLYCYLLNHYKVKRTRKKSHKINTMFLAVPLAILIAFFFYFGAIKGTGSIDNFSLELMRRDMMSYTSSSLSGLDSYLSFPWKENTYFGEYSLVSFYRLFGIEVDRTTTFLPFIRFGINSYSTNIYTELPVLIQDYSLWGMLALKLCLSFLVTKLTNYLLSPKKNYGAAYFSVLFVWLSCVYGFFMSGIGFLLFGEIFTKTFIVAPVFYSLLFSMVPLSIDKKRIINIKKRRHVAACDNAGATD